MEKFSRKDWLNYLNNLNSREISKRNASGFTLWALFGLFGFTLFKLLDSLPIIFTDVRNVFLTTLFFTNIFNFSIVVALFILTLVIPQSRKRKITTELSNKGIILSSVIVNFIFIVGIICNIYIVIFSKHYGLSTISYYVFGIYGVINTIGKIIFAKIIVTKDNKMPKVDFGTYYSTKDKNPIKYMYGFACLALLCLLILSVYQIIQSNYILDHLDLIKSSIYLSILIASTILFSYQLNLNMRYEWVEQFERKIILKNLNENEIVKIFLNEFVGKDVLQWLKEIEDETKEEKTIIREAYNKFENEFSNLRQEEKDLNKKSMQAEIIIEKLGRLTKRFMELQDKFIDANNKLEYFLKQGPFSDEEYLLVRKIIHTNHKDYQSLLGMNPKFKKKLKEIKEYVDTIKEPITLEDK
jgi:hypothetical protein